MNGIDLEIDETIETLLGIKENIYSIKDKNLRTSLLLMADIVFHAIQAHVGQVSVMTNIENMKANMKMMNHWYHITTKHGIKNES